MRLPPRLHATLARQAAAAGVSLNTLCVELLSEGAGAAQKPDGSPVFETRCLALVRSFSEQTGTDVRGVVLFGSAARGQLRADSDVDLLLVLPRSEPLSRQRYRAWDECLAGHSFEREINAHFVHLPERAEDAGSLWLEVAVEGIVLADEGGQVYRWLVELRRAIAAGRFARYTEHGQPYWKRAA